MKVLVTGTDGYIGAVVPAALAASGHEVVGVDTGFHRSGWLYHHRPTLPLTLTKDIRLLDEADLDSVDGVATDATVTEQSPTNPQTAYAVSKTLVERALAALADDGLSPIFLRNA